MIQTLTNTPLAFIDTETTGVGPDARIVQVAVTHLDPGDTLPRVALCRLVTPEVPIPAAASIVHGIHDSDVHQEPTWLDVGPEVAEAMKGRVPVAFNAIYDYLRLKHECERFGLPVPRWPWVCVLVAVKAVEKYASGKKLHETCLRHGIVVAPHGAAGDTVATALLWRALVAKYKVLQDASQIPIRDFMRGQLRLALDQECDWFKYKLKDGAHGDRPDAPWHELHELEPPEWVESLPPSAACPGCGGQVLYRVAMDGTVELVEVATGSDQDPGDPRSEPKIPHVCNAST
jgi:DNA polymerase III epsilon subunit-like protein